MTRDRKRIFKRGVAFVANFIAAGDLQYHSTRMLCSYTTRQGDAIKTLERAVDSRASRMELTSALQQKADAAEVGERLMELAAKLNSKADAAHVATQLERRATRADVQALAAAVEARASKDDLLEATGAAERAVAALRGELRRKADAEEMAARLDTKANIVEVGKALDSKPSMAQVEELVRERASKAALAAGLKKKPDRDEVEVALARLAEEQAALAASVHDLASKQQPLRSDVGRLKEELASTRAATQQDNEVTVAALRTLGQNWDAALAAVNTKLSKAEGELGDVRKELEAKCDVAAVNEALAHKANVVSVNSALKALEEELAARSAVKDEIDRALTLKANVKDVVALLDVKANVDDVNAALVEVNAELSERAPLAEFRQAMREQAVINASLATDACVGRWIWKNGRTRPGSNAVPWNIQSVNTDPENYLWEKDKSSIVAVAPGLYEVTFGFFTRKKPTVQLLVNGEPVLSAVNAASYVLHHSSGRLTSVGRHPAGNIAGLTLIDFLALPPRARVAITYVGEENGEGFLSLKKL
eukprot:jgi/Mesvir1/2937/Mv14002-RA.1